MTALAWGAKVDDNFRARVRFFANELGADPSHLMACMAFETSRTFSPSIKNPNSSGTGLIQFMRDTAVGLGTTVEALAQMTALEQLEFVRKYFLPYAGKLNTLADCYAAVIWPRAVGKPDDYVVFGKGSTAYEHNAGLDFDRNGAVTKGECAEIVEKLLTEGLRPENATEMDEAQPEQPMAEETTTSINWDNVLQFGADASKIGGAVLSFFNPIAGGILTALSPMLQQKVSKELSRHTDPETAKLVAANLSDTLLAATRGATAKSTDVEAAMALTQTPGAVAAVEQAVTSRLTELGPIIDKLAAIDQELAQATRKGRDEAATRALKDPFDVAPLMVANVTSTSNWLLGGLVGATIVSIVVKALYPNVPDYVPMLLPVIGLLAGQISKERGAIIGYRFDGTPASNAANAINVEMARGK